MSTRHIKGLFLIWRRYNINYWGKKPKLDISSVLFIVTQIYTRSACAPLPPCMNLAKSPFLDLTLRKEHDKFVCVHPSLFTFFYAYSCTFNQSPLFTSWFITYFLNHHILFTIQCISYNNQSIKLCLLRL